MFFPDLFFFLGGGSSGVFLMVWVCVCVFFPSVLLYIYICCSGVFFDLFFICPLRTYY